MKTIYLVRHGETVGNQQNFHQFPETPLTDIGLFQAERLAHRFKKIEVEQILVSSYKRTQQTAKIIAQNIGLAPKTKKIFREYTWPKEILGKMYEDPQAKVVREQVIANQLDPTWHYSDEENLHEFNQRVQKAQRYLTAQSAEKTLVVSHGMFISTFIYYVVSQHLTSLDLKSNLKAMISFIRSTKSENCGISVVKYDKNEWQLVTFNDHAHLG